MLRIDAFCESGAEVGLGHLRRCENLIALFKQSLAPLQLRCQIHSLSIHSQSLPSPPQEGDYDILILDSYTLAKSDYDKLARKSKALLCLDDFKRLPYPPKAYVLSPSFGKRSKYSGKDYSILHPAFSSQATQNPKQGQLLIALGGSNTGLIQSLLDALPQGLDPHIISPSFSHPSYPCHSGLGAEEICALIDGSEFVITAGGTSLNEAISRGKKILALCIAPNQKPQLNAYKNQIPVIFNPFSKLSPKLSFALQNLPPAPKLSFGSRLPSLALKLFYQALQLPSHIKPFSALSKQESKQLLHLRNQEAIRKASFHQDPISPKEHRAFLRKLRFPSLYFAFLRGRRVRGVGSLQILSAQKALLSIYKDPQSHSIRGSEILDFLFTLASKLSLPILELKVLKSNTKAILFYQRHGFVIIQEAVDHLTMQHQNKELL